MYFESYQQVLNYLDANLNYKLIDINHQIEIINYKNMQFLGSAEFENWILNNSSTISSVANNLDGMRGQTYA
ncbi:hypothetical protein SCLARK_00665 [Spiroplasma clarkii]|nr:hypothetical protein [Spiroplasma clarkii]ARU91328.1 hypothetical protein SCLARK_00665 [Spiroplasma clarkii]